MPLRVLAEFLLLYLTCADYNGKGLGTIIKARRPDTRGEYMKKEEAFQDGMEAKAIEDARSFYENGVSIELIAKSLHMSVDQVKEIIRTN